MSGEILTTIGVGMALGLFIWRVAARLDGRIDRLDLRIDGLQKELHDLAREFSELRGGDQGRPNLTPPHPAP